MKNFNRLMTVVLCSATLYLFVTAKSDLDLMLGISTLLMGFVFMCFAIMEEQKEEVARLRKGIDSYKRSMKHSW